MGKIFPLFAAAVPLLFSVAACQVSKDNGNGTVSMTYNQDVAKNAADDAASTAKAVANDIGSDVKAAGEKIDNKIDNTHVKLDVTTNNTAEKK
ncbi:hypothetical protein ABDK56_01675 [Sphingomonas sp. ASV193]|uniref:hypothetical protein n=1 Tax=Sphingomonas sp. ASV193 TaxID=3144405 RepID=UPI0032E8C6B9